MRRRAEQPGLSLRERIAGHEDPRTVLKGPPIAIGCSCGERRSVAYGAVWECSCGRRWSTAQINRDDYVRLRNVQLRFRAVPVALGLTTSGLALVFLLSSNSWSIFFLLPCALILWGMVLRPILRRRYEKALGVLPTWELRPEPNSQPDAERVRAAGRQ